MRTIAARTMRSCVARYASRYASRYAALCATLFGALGVVAVAPPVLVAQGPVAVHVEADNDAFTFWLPPWKRTDHEYTSGVYGQLEYRGPSSLLPLGRLRPTGCAASGCAAHSLSLGQALYTGEEPPAPGLAPPRSPSLRPNAAWLYVEAAERDSAGRDATEYRFDLGVVGPPALGAPLQRFFHDIGPAYPKPVDWRNQLPFEPGFVASLIRTHILATGGDANRVAGTLAVRAGASVGTILTAVTVGATATTTVPIGPAMHNRLWPRIVLSADGDLHGVLRDEFLDGTLFRASQHVAKNPAYDTERASLELRWKRITLAYRATRAGTQYELQRAPMVWGTLAAEWRPAN